MRKALILFFSGFLFASMKITIIVDNNPYLRGLKTAWGFSALIERENIRLLFDTGPSPEVLDYNMKKLGISQEKIRYIFLSHKHMDHIGGLEAALRKGQKVFILPSFPSSVKKLIKEKGGVPVEVKDEKEILPNFYSSGPMGTWIKEQSLFIRTSGRLIVITGCAHPGVLNIARRGKKLGNIALLLGGFHLAWSHKSEVERIAEKLKKIGVKTVAPLHCSGEISRRVFSHFFGKNLIKGGIGFIFNIKEEK